LGVTSVTSPGPGRDYLFLIEARRFGLRSKQMTKLYSILFAAMLLAPMAFATLNQAAQIVA